MYVCMYVSIYILCIYICIYVCVCVCVCVCARARVLEDEGCVKMPPPPQTLDGAGQMIVGARGQLKKHLMCLSLHLSLSLALRWLLEHEVNSTSVCYENESANKIAFEPPPDNFYK